MRTWWTLALAVTLAACTLAVSTDGLHETPSSTPDASPSTSDTGAPEAAIEASTPLPEAGADATPTAELPGLIGAWLFDDGTTNDSSGKGRPGQLSGSVEVGPDPARGNVLLLLGGTMQVSALAGPAFPKSGTVSLWVRWTEMVQKDTQLLFDGWDDSRRHLFLRHSNDAPVGEFQFALQQRDAFYVAEGYVAVPKNEWQHLIVSWDAEKRFGLLYRNGKVVSRDAYDGDFVPDEQHVDIGRFLRGAIDDVRLFERALSESEASALP